MIFRLSPNGKVSAIHLLKKSGVNVIDNAVRHVLLSLAPISIAHKYLERAALMQVRVLIR